MQNTSESLTPSSTETGTPPEPTTNRSALLIVFLVVFIDLLGFGIVLPMLPVIAEEYIARVLPGDKTTINGLVLGLLMSSFSLMQFLFAPVWGRISDRIGRRPILLLGLTGSVVFYGLFGYAASFDPQTLALTALVLFFATRIGQGIFGATISTAQAVIADSTPPDKRKHGMAIIGAAFGIGFTFGPLIGYFALSKFKDHPEAIGYTAAAISLVALILGLVMLPETRIFGQQPPIKRRLLNLSAWRWALASAAIGPVVLVFFLATFGFAGFEVTLALLLKNVMRIDPDSIFLYFAYIGFVLMMTQGYFYRKAAKKMAEPALMTFGILCMGLGVAALGAVSYQAVATGEIAGYLFGLLMGSLTVSVVGFAFLTPSAQALISRRTDADHQGEILGINQSASALARILGPMIFLPLYEATATRLLPYAFGAALVLLMLPIMPRIRKG